MFGNIVALTEEDYAEGIEETLPLTPPSMEGSIYNLQGQRMNSLQRGLNVVDGKKIYVK
jgi:hypothetical protein